MFANSGIPLLQKLSDLYSKLRGEVVTASQVREMVTNRQVSFEDVETVIKQMTDAGGEFYQMQEVMAESLSAKWRNLANDWNLMLGSIAESAFGDILKGVAEGLMVVVENWRKVIAAGISFSVVMIPFKTVIGFIDKGAKATENMTEKISLTRKGWEGFKASFNTPHMWANISAIAVAWWQAAREAEEFREKVNGVGSRIKEQATIATASMNALVDKLRLAQNNQEEYSRLIDEFNNKYSQYVGHIKEEASAFGEVEKAAQNAASAIYEKIRAQEQDQAITEVTNQYGKKIKDAVHTLRNNIMYDFSNENFEFPREWADDIVGSIRKMLNEGKTAAEIADYLNTAFADYKIDASKILGHDAFSDLQKEILAMNEDISYITSQAGGIDNYPELTKKVNKYYDDLISSTSDLNEKMELEMNRYRDIIKVLSEGGVTLGDGTKINGTFSGVVSQYRSLFDEYEAMISKEWLKTANEIFQKEFTYSVGGDATPTILMDLKAGKDDVDYLKYLEKLAKKYKELTKSKKEREAVDEKYRTDPASIKKYELEVEEIKRLDKLAATLGFKWSDFDKKTGSTKKGEDNELAAWKERAKLINEAYQEYKKYYDLWQDTEKSKAKVKENPLFANLDVDPSAIIENYDKLISTVKSKMGEDKNRRMFELDLEGKRFNIKFDLDKDDFIKQTEEAVADINQIINDNKDNFDYFKQLFNATGDSNYAKKWSEFMADQVYSLLNVDRDFNIDQLIKADPETLRQYVNEERQLKALKIALEEYNKALKDDKKLRLSYMLEGTKYMRTYKDELIATNAEFAKMAGIEIEEGFSDFIELPENANEEVTKLHNNYKKLFATIAKKSTSGMLNLIEQLREANRKGDTEEKGKAANAVFSQSISYLDEIFAGIQNSSEAMKNFGKETVEALKNISSIISRVASGDYFGAAVSMASTFAGIIASDTNERTTYRQENSQRMLQVKIDLVNNNLERLADVMEEEYTIADRTDAYESQKKEIQDLKKLYVAGMNNSVFFGNRKDVMSQLFKLELSAGSDYSFEDLMKILDTLDATTISNWLWLGFVNATDANEMLLKLSELRDKEKELEETFSNQTLGFDFSDLKQSFVDTLMDMDSSSQDFWDSFADYAVKASMNEFVGSNIQSELEKVYNSFKKEFTANNGSVSEDSIKAWRKSVENLYETAQEEAEYLNQIWGRGESEDEGLSSSIQGMTEDTAEIIAAYLNTITANVTMVRTCEESIAYEQLPMLQFTADAQLAQLQMQTDHLQAIRESNEGIYERIQNLDDNFSATLNGTKRISMD